ncbi:nucleotidyltransferase family protein [Devosia aurantiaca]|uniref:Nucleotidyltransferase family protein n=1 Tax=Devosia aurantiaca TaxID=2714858 RepID=A0A6M1S8T8_9HYPH|nr:nucleotidyltransferase family protein [Devosia aurantiaca]NGP16429.1 nucleotidyltransferase family protein [Devosia aurantiaca]
MVEPDQGAVVVLAAGLSRRFGADDKLLADLDGQPLVQHCAETLSRLDFAHHIAVCQDNSPLTTLFADRGFSVLINPDSAQGQASSLALGVAEAAKRDANFVLICLADMPFITAEHLLHLVDVLDHTPNGVAASAAHPDAPPTPPAIFAAQHFPELMALTGDQGARHLLRQAQIVISGEGELADFDTPADFG